MEPNAFHHDPELPTHVKKCLYIDLCIARVRVILAQKYCIDS